MKKISRNNGPIALRRLAMLLAITAVGSPASAMAQDEEGVFVDPDSPTAKEYALPAEDARRQSDPNGGDDGVRREQGARTAPPFGAGIGDGDGPSAGSGGEGDEAGDAPSSGGADDERGKSRESDDGTGAAGPALRASSAQAGAPPAGGGTLMTIAGLGAGIVLAGVAGGAMFRRHRSQS
jgi:hypothetical protein